MPTATNYGAASALPYHLIKFRRAGIDVLIYSFNINHASETIISETERVLGVRIRIIPLPNWYFESVPQISFYVLYYIT